MEIASVRQIQALVRGRRADLHLTQAGLALRARVSRKWVSDFERGRMTGPELGLVLQVLEALGIVIDAHPIPPGEGGRGRDEPSTPQADDVDLDEVLARHVLQ